MQKYWLQSASQLFSGLPSLVSADRPVSRPPNCLWALKHLFQLALPSWPPDFTFSRCHLHITLNQNPQWAMEKEKKNKTRKQALETMALQFSGRHTGTLWNGDVTRHYRVYVCVCVCWHVHVCVRWWLHKIIRGLLKYLCVNASVRVIARNCLVLEVQGIKKIYFYEKKSRQWRDVQWYVVCVWSFSAYPLTLAGCNKMLLSDNIVEITTDNKLELLYFN